MMRALCFILLLSWGVQASAAVYKCKDSSGGISYSQSPCTSQQSLDKVMHVTNSYDAGVECGIVRNFAAEVGLRMSEHASLKELENAFGGASELSELALKIIHSVHAFQSRPFVTVENSVHNENANCKDEIYGFPQCSDFPTDFIKIYGNCNAAADVNLRIKRINEFQNPAMDQQVATNQQLESSSHTSSQLSQTAGTAPSPAQERKACLKAIDAKLRQNRESSRQALDVRGQDKLREQRRELQAARKDC